MSKNVLNVKSASCLGGQSKLMTDKSPKTSKSNPIMKVQTQPKQSLFMKKLIEIYEPQQSVNVELACEALREERCCQNIFKIEKLDGDYGELECNEVTMNKPKQIQPPKFE